MGALNCTLECFDGYDLCSLARVGIPECREELRRRNCDHRFDADQPEHCECWACLLYGLSSYHGLQCHPDGNYGQCRCWQCSMRRISGEQD
jgi:hypothetical protein